MLEQSFADDYSLSASLTRGGPVGERAKAEGIYTVTCVRPDGSIRWQDDALNTVTTQGKNHALDSFLRAQTQITAWYVGLISSVSYSATAAGDTAAQINGTNGWKEAASGNAPNYSQSTRPALTVGNAAASGTLTASAVSAFTMSASGTVKGCFLVSNSTKESTSGVLYSAGVFSGGDRAVISGDTINVTYAASL